MEKIKVLRKHMAVDAIVINKAALEDVLYQAIDNHIKQLKKTAREIDNIDLPDEMILHEKLSGRLIGDRVLQILFPEEEE